MKNNKYEIIDQVLNNIPENFSILEEEVDVRIQKEFFDMSENLILMSKTIRFLLLSMKFLTLKHLKTNKR